MKLVYIQWYLMGGLFCKRHSHSSVRAYYFAIRVINVWNWNSLPADRVDFSSFASFKRTVEQIDFTPFLLCYHD